MPTFLSSASPRPGGRSPSTSAVAGVRVASSASASPCPRPSGRRCRTAPPDRPRRERRSRLSAHVVDDGERTLRGDTLGCGNLTTGAPPTGAVGDEAGEGLAVLAGVDGSAGCGGGGGCCVRHVCIIHRGCTARQHRGCMMWTWTFRRHGPRTSGRRSPGCHRDAGDGQGRSVQPGTATSMLQEPPVVRIECRTRRPLG